MKIGLDAKRAFLNQTGLGNYSRGVIFALLEHYPENDYFLFTPKIIANDFYNKLRSFKNVTIVQPRSTLFHSYWRSYRIPSIANKLALDVYHGLSNEIPYNIKKFKGRKIATIHDLIPFKEDAFRNPIDDFFYKTKMHSACKNADLIIAISQATMKDIVHYFRTPENKIKVVYQSVPNNTFISTTDVVSKYNLPERFILQVGTVEYRKNIQIIIRALIKLNIPDLHYVIVGRKKRFWKSLSSYGANHGLGSRMHFIDPVNDEELNGFYKASKAVMYPSLYEGFGLPIVEAIQHGKPVLTTKGSCFEEAGGKGAYYCDTNDVKDVANTLSNMLRADHTSVLAAGKEHISRFSSRNAADSLMAIYRK